MVYLKQATCDYDHDYLELCADTTLVWKLQWLVSFYHHNASQSLDSWQILSHIYHITMTPDAQSWKIRNYKQ